MHGCPVFFNKENITWVMAADYFAAVPATFSAAL